ncbi:MAG: hypothetical protein E7595_04690 [Ruminococcaceae bacterium]|nr:hypothetical protein [Oscillospiraceae bacterium]
MKKILAIILACFFAVSFVACGGGEDESSATLGTSSTAGESKVEESSKVTVSEDESSEAATSEDPSEAVSEGETSEGETSEGETSEGEGDEPVEVTFTNKYVSWKVATGNGARTDVTATEATSLQLSKVNEDVVAGDVGVFTYDKSGKTLDTEGLEDFAIVVAKYDHETFSYVRDEFYAVGEADDTVSIPKDGFVIVIYKTYEDKINAISTTTNPLFPHGFVSNTGLDAKIKSAKKTPTIDGNATSGEYGEAIWDIKPDNALVSYAQFDKNNYFATAKVYMTYDAEYLYLAVVVDTPYHFCPVNESTKGDIWKYSAIQVNFGANGRDTDYIDEHWDWQIDKTSTNDNLMRQYGFCISDEGQQYSVVWQGDSSILCDTYCVTREGDITTYEVALKWSDLGKGDEKFAPKKGDRVQVAVSFNLGLSEAESFKNITLRDGGGIIGINDWTKIPTITLN